MSRGVVAGVAAVAAVVAVGALLLWGGPGPGGSPAPGKTRSAVPVPPAGAPAAPPAADPGGDPAAPAAPDGSSPDAAATAARGTISGVVRYTEGEDAPAPEVLVVLARGPEGSRDEVARTKSDAEGRFSFPGLAPGEHSFSTLALEGEMWDFEHETATVEPASECAAELWVEKPLPPGTGIRVRGTVKYEDGRPAGRFRFELDDEDSSYRVESENGAFERRLPRAGVYRVWSVRADMQDWDDLDLEFQVAEGEPVAIVLPLPRDAAVAVVARATGAPLPSARVYRHVDEPDAWNYDDYPNPATVAGEPLRADARGRVSLGPGIGREVVFAIADGFAWKRVEVARGGDGPTVVALDPGGSLGLTVAGWALLEHATVAAESDDPWRRWTLPPPGDDGRAEYEGLPAGEWTVRIRRGLEYQHGEVYGEGEVSVAAGGRTEATIATRPPESRPPAPVAGTVTVPAEWGRRRTHLWVQGAEPTNVSVERNLTLDLPADGTPVRFELEPVPPGDYLVTVAPQFNARVTVPPGGARFEFRVPPPGTLIVRVLDAATDAPLEGVRIWWHVPVKRSTVHLQTAERGDAAGVYRVVAPAGSVRLMLSCPGYTDEEVGPRAPGDEGNGSAALPVVAGEETAVTIRMRRAGVVRVVFRWEGASPDWEEASVHLVSRDEDGSESWESLGVEKGTATTDDAPPGPYELRVEDLGDEFEEVPPRAVTVVPGETTTVEVRLVRRR